MSPTELSVAFDPACPPTTHLTALKNQAESLSVDGALYPDTTPHLNPHGLCLLDRQDGKGRGVYTSRAMQKGTLLEISPVLVLSQKEYSRPAGVGETVLKDYVFTWDRTGRQAVALGLGAVSCCTAADMHAQPAPGSIFNHSASPNVSFQLCRSSKTIAYTLTRDVAPSEELCIFYGVHAKFGTAGDFESEEETLDGWDAISSLNGLIDSTEATSIDMLEALKADRTDELVPFAKCPCTKVTAELSLADLPLELGT
jgi:tRNA-specific adenosine deaminase 3